MQGPGLIMITVCDRLMTGKNLLTAPRALWFDPGLCTHATNANAKLPSGLPGVTRCASPTWPWACCWRVPFWLFFLERERAQVKFSIKKPVETRNEDCGFFFHEGGNTTHEE